MATLGHSEAGSAALRALKFAAVLSALLASTFASQAQQQGTAAQRRACKPDVFRLCGDFIPDRDKITACLKAHTKQLSPDCRAVFSGRLR